MAVGGPRRTRLALLTLHSTNDMSTEHTPLLSDEKSREIEMKWQEAHGADITHTMAFSDGIATVRDLYESERAKDRELIQLLVNVAKDRHNWSSEYALGLAREAGITPVEL